MICKFCGDEFAGRPVKQGSQLYCSIGCADLAAEMLADADDEDEYYDEHELEMDVTEDEEEIY